MVTTITVSGKDGIDSNGGSSNGSAASDNNCSGSGRETNELSVKMENCMSYSVHNLNLPYGKLPVRLT